MTDIDAAPWIRRAIERHSVVTSLEALDDGTLLVNRKRHGPLKIAPVSTERIDAELAERILDTCAPDIILRVPKLSHYDWDAREIAEDRGSTIHTFKELFTFLDLEDPRPYVDKVVWYP